MTAPHLADVFDFRPDQGIIRLHEQRVILLSAAAMGLLRKELIDTLDLETARRLFLRFGYADGYHDAVSLRDRGKWSDRFEGLRAGIVLHRLAGIARPEIVQLEHEATSGRFLGEVVWHDSYVAEQHVHHYGKSDTPVCWSLVGYASGYASACLGEEIYFRENECLAQGVSHCTVVGRAPPSVADSRVWFTRSHGILNEMTNENRRPHPRHMDTPYLEFDIARELQQLHLEPGWQSGQNAKTLVKYDGLRIVLIALKAGSRIPEHHTEGQVSRQTIVGHIQVRADGRSFELRPGGLLALDQGLPHDVEALEESAFLLTIAWPGDKDRSVR